MIKSKRAVALTLAFGGFAACPALAQYQSPPPMNRSLPDPPAATEAVPAAPGRKYDLSKAARKAIVELQTAVNANDTANIAAKLAAAQAVAKTADDKLVIGQLQLKAAVNQKNDAAIGAALEAMLASGAAGPGDALPLHTNLGKHYFNSKQYDRAASQFERVLALDPSNSEAILLFAETRRVQGRAPEAVALLQKAIAASTAAGRKPSEDLYKHAVQLSYDAKLPTAIPLSREWVATYPTPANWSAALRIYQRGSGLDNDVLIDLMRLQRANGALAGESDYFNYANTALLRGYPGEAKAVLEEGFAAKKIDRSKPIFRDVLAEASSKAAADRASLAGLEATAIASPSAKQAMVTGDAYLGYGEWAKAAALYRAALTKSGVDPNVANLRLGIALARSGDKAGATTAFNAVSGTRADIAKYWLLYLSTRA